MWLPWLIISLIFCSFTALSTPSLQQGACVLCTMGNAMTKCIFQRWWHHCISHPTYSSSNVIVMVHQGMVRAWEDTCNCLANKCSRGDIMKFLMLLLIQCGMVFWRHRPLKPWVAMLEVGWPWSCYDRLHADRGRCLKNVICSRTAVQVFPVQVPHMHAKKPLGDFSSELLQETLS